MTPDVGLIQCLDLISDNIGTITYKLFTNDIQPDGDTVYTDFTEATFPGYSATAATNWTATPAINDDGYAEITADQITFTRSSGAGSETIYGYYALDSSNNVIDTRRFPSGEEEVIDSEGQTVQITPKLVLGNKAP